MNRIKNWLSADTLSGRHIGGSDIWTDPMNNGDKIFTVIGLLFVVGCIVFCLV